MASVHHEIVIEADAANVWDVIRDVSAVHERLLPGRVAATRLDRDQRVLTFPNGREVREWIIDIDDQRRRVAYAVSGGDSLGLTYHHASFEVVSDGPGRCLLVWITDVLPHNLADQVRARVIAAAEEIRRTLEGV
jgi:carbon monoxide dehydrogenase subunit G